MPLLIRGGRVLRGDAAALERADVLVDGDRIAAVGPHLERPAGIEEIDASPFLVLPGLVNAHTHAHNNLLRGLADRWTLEDLLNHGPALNANRTPEDHCNQNLFEAMRIAGLVGNARFPHHTARWLEAREVWRMATVGSATALGLGGEIGAIEPGHQADIVLLRAGALSPLNDAVSSLVFVETAADVDTVLVGGRVVVRGGRVLTVDVDRLRARAQEAAERVRARNASAWTLAEEIAPYLSTACHTVVATPYPVNRYAAPAG